MVVLTATSTVLVNVIDPITDVVVLCTNSIVFVSVTLTCEVVRNVPVDVTPVVKLVNVEYTVTGSVCVPVTVTELVCTRMLMIVSVVISVVIKVDLLVTEVASETLVVRIDNSVVFTVVVVLSSTILVESSVVAIVDVTVAVFKLETTLVTTVVANSVLSVETIETNVDEVVST